MQQFNINIIFRKLLLIAILLFSVMGVFAQNIKFEHINRDNGLPVNTVTCLTQDNNGFIWMGSMYGLVKFDGNNYKLFEYDYADPHSLPGFFVTQIISAANGLIYVTVMNNGISLLNPETEKFNNFLPDSTNNPESCTVNAMVEDLQGNLWLGTNNGLYYFNTKKYSFTRHFINNDITAHDSAQSNQEYISALALDKNNNLYIFGYKNSLMFFNTKTFKYKAIKYTQSNQTTLPLISLGKLYIDDKQNIWIGTEHNGVFVYNPERKTEVNHYLKGTMISAIEKINNNIWIGSEGKGLLIIDTTGQIAYTLTNNPYNPYSLSSDAIQCIAETRDHTVWIGSYGTGLNLYNESLYKFSTISQIKIQGNKLSNKSILCMDKVGNSKLLLGTDGGGINVLNLKTQKVNVLESQSGALSNKVIKSICKNNNNSFYAGTYGQGLFYCSFNINNSITANSIERKTPSKYKYVWSIFKQSDTAIWIGYLNSGLSIYNPVKNSFIDSPEFDGIDVVLIKQINDDIWVSGEHYGLYICNNNGVIIKKYENDGYDTTSISSNQILAIFKDSKERIWIGTGSGGLNLLTNKDSGQFKVYNTKNGFPTNFINNIEEDDKGILWLSSDIGLIKFDPNSLIAKVFDKKDGLQGKTFNYNASFNNNNQNIYFGGVEGLSYFRPSYIKQNSIPPQIAFTHLHIGNNIIKVGEKINGHIILNQFLSYVSNIKLSHKDDDFTIEFTALHFESSKKNKYKYMLEGFDKQWKTCQPGQKSARYTNLKKGSFVFKVKAANPDNVWNNKPIELHIKIMPPFYNTTVFYIFAIIFLIIALITFIKWRTINLIKAKEKLEILVNLRTQELQEKAEMVLEQNEEIISINNQLKEYNKTRDKIFSIIAHDLRSPLSAIISFSSMLLKDINQISEADAKTYIDIINQTSTQMNDLIINLLYWVNNQIGKINTKPEIISLELVFNEVKDLTIAKALQKNISISFNHNNSTVYADLEMIVTIMRNLVSNSLKFTPEKGSIEINANTDSKHTTILVSDTGIGMSKEQLSVLEDEDTLTSTKGTGNEPGTGLGLHLCKEFVTKNNGQFFIESQKGKGTTVKFIFPSKKL